MNNSSLIDNDSNNGSTIRRRLRSRTSSNDNRVTLIEFDNNDNKNNDGNDNDRKSTKRFKPIKRELEVAHETPNNWEKVGIFTVKQIKIEVQF